MEGELQRHPQFVVLEREQLQQLIAEQNLTGVERKLRGTAWLLEAGVRRTQGNQGLVITGRLHSPGLGTQHKLRVEIATQDLARARGELARAIEKAVGKRASETEAVELQAEAAIFAQRRDWFERAYRNEEAAEMAEAALALRPPQRIF